jgi:hypothetical protein
MKLPWLCRSNDVIAKDGQMPNFLYVKNEENYLSTMTNALISYTLYEVMGLIAPLRGN